MTGKQILVVEDDVNLRKMIAKHLEKAGYSVELMKYAKNLDER